MQRLDFEKHFLDHAELEAKKRGLYDFPIFDADAHYMVTPLEKIAEFLKEPWRDRLQKAPIVAAFNTIPRDLGDRTIADRMKTIPHFRRYPKPENEKLPKEIYPLLESSRKMAIDYSLVFPTDLLALGLHPQSDLEVAIAFGYAYWMTEKILPCSEALKTMLYLPFSDPQACIRLVKEFAGKKGVVGFMVTSTRYQPVHHNSYMPLYKLLEGKGLPLGFHTVSNWMERPFQQFNRFLSAHALGFPLYNMIQLTNLVINGIPERFPDLKMIFIEAGISWIPFIMHRLDSEYMCRTSEAPLLKKKPSEYIKNFYFTSQPLEQIEDIEYMKKIFDLFDAENQLLYASDYPHQDFDSPSTIYDLPFLSERAKRKILGENALNLFGIKDPQLYARV